MFNVELQKTVAGWGQAKNVNYAKPTPPRAFQHWTWGHGGLTHLFFCAWLLVWLCRSSLNLFCELYSVNRRIFVFVASCCSLRVIDFAWTVFVLCFFVLSEGVSQCRLPRAWRPTRSASPASGHLLTDASRMGTWIHLAMHHYKTTLIPLIFINPD